MKPLKRRNPDVPVRKRLGVVAAVLVVLGAFGITACQPSPADTALHLTLTDTASAGAPAANVTVSVFPANDTTAPAVADGITDAGGNAWFTHDALAAGDYVVRFGSGSSTTWWPAASSRAAADAVTVTGSDPVEITGSLAVEIGYILGDVTDGNGDGIPGVEVTAYDAASGDAVLTTSTVSAGLTGTYWLYSGALHMGQTYKIGFSKSGHATGYAGPGGSLVSSLADAATIAAGSPNQVHVDATLQPESTITGTVKPDGTNPMGGVGVIAVVASTNHAATWTMTAADGTFTLEGLSGIGYRLAFVTPGNTYAPMMLGGGTGPGVSFDVADGSAFSLQPGGTLSVGTVSLTVGAHCAAAQAGGSTYLLGADLHNCDLSDADLTSVDLYDADLTGANLSHATLPNFGLVNSPSLGAANLSKANLSHAQSPSSGSPNIGSADLSGADLSHADMSFSYLTGSDLTGANLSATNLSNGAIDATDLSGTDLSSATFSDTDTYDLAWTTPPRIPAGYELAGTNLVGAGVLLARVDLSGADLSGMNLASIHLSQVDLTGADLTNTTLTDITWNVVDLSGADLSGATLTVGYSAHLTANANTVLPTGWEIVNGSFQQTPP